MAQQIRGVALIVENPQRDILILQEFVDKPHLGKRSGMFSIPMETAETGEEPLQTLERLEREEIPKLPLVDTPRTYIGRFRIVAGVWVRLYRTQTRSRALPVAAEVHAREVGNYRWLPVEAALTLWLRQGAREMIEMHASGQVNVLCKECRAPPPGP